MNKRKSSQTERQRVLILQENTSFCAVYEAGGNYTFLMKFIAFWSILAYSWLVILLLHRTGPYVFYNFSSIISEGPCAKDIHVCVYVCVYICT